MYPGQTNTTNRPYTNRCKKVFLSYQKRFISSSRGCERPVVGQVDNDGGVLVGQDGSGVYVDLRLGLSKVRNWRPCPAGPHHAQLLGQPPLLPARVLLLVEESDRGCQVGTTIAIRQPPTVWGRRLNMAQSTEQRHDSNPS